MSFDFYIFLFHFNIIIFFLFQFILDFLHLVLQFKLISVANRSFACFISINKKYLIVLVNR